MYPAITGSVYLKTALKAAAYPCFSFMILSLRPLPIHLISMYYIRKCGCAPIYLIFRRSMHDLRQACRSFLQKNSLLLDNEQERVSLLYDIILCGFVKNSTLHFEIFFEILKCFAISFVFVPMAFNAVDFCKLFGIT